MIIYIAIVIRGMFLKQVLFWDFAIVVLQLAFGDTALYWKVILIYEIVTECLKCRKIFSNWVLKMLKQNHKNKCLATGSTFRFLEHHNQDDDDFLS